MTARRLIPFLLACCAAIAGCEAPCSNEIAHTLSSPNGKLKAVVFNRDCGATTGFNTQISVLPASEALGKEGGNALVADGRPTLQLHWLSDQELRISGLSASQVFKQENSVAGVIISVNR